MMNHSIGRAIKTYGLQVAVEESSVDRSPNRIKTTNTESDRARAINETYEKNNK